MAIARGMFFSIASSGIISSEDEKVTVGSLKEDGCEGISEDCKPDTSESGLDECESIVVGSSC